ARRAHQYERVLPLERPLPQARNLLADHRTHGTAHEREVHYAEADGHSPQGAAGRDNRVRVACVGGRLLQTLRVLGKAERVHRSQLDIELLPAAVVHEEPDIVPRADPAMVVAVGTHVEIAHELLAQIRVPACLALLPRIRGNLEALATGLPDLPVLSKPGHSRNVGGADRPGKNGGVRWPDRRPWRRALRVQCAPATQWPASRRA